MLIIISPAKTMDYETPVPSERSSTPAFLDKSKLLINRLRDFSALDLCELQHVSIKIAELNFERNQLWKTPFTASNSRQAVFAFKGDVYNGLDAYTLNTKNLQFAQDHLAILSGLYGLLRPLDLIRPYRLEMGTKLTTSGARNLYDFWDMIITDAINRQLSILKSDILINLASNEYFKAVKTKALQARIITPVFKEYKNGEYKVIAIYAKKARGLMSRFIVENELSDIQALKQFHGDGYQFKSALSDEGNWVFTRR